MFQVEGISSVGRGDTSANSALVRTGPLLPATPSTPSVTGVGQYSALITWSAPGYDGGSAVLSYMASAYSMPEDTLVKSVQSENLQANITELLGFALYIFRVRAVNLVGAGSFSLASDATRTLQVPPGPPGQALVTDLEQYAFLLSWGLPVFDGGSAVTGFRVWCSEGASLDSLFSVLISDTGDTATSSRLFGLKGFTPYRCYVAAINDFGLGLPSAVADMVRTLPVPPYSPWQPGISDVGLAQLLLSWEAPQGDSGSELSGYKVLRRGSGAEAWEVVCNDTGSNETSWAVADLDSYTAHYFAVAGLNSIGDGQLSPISDMAFTAAIGVPYPPASPILTEVSPSSVLVTFVAPNSGGSNITGYTVELAVSNAPSSFAQAVNTTSLSVRLLGLLGSTSYRVRVVVMSTGGLSLPGQVSQFLTSPAVAPAAPTSIAVSMDVPYAAVVTWAEPLDEGGQPVQAYVVFAGQSLATMQEISRLNAQARSAPVARLLGGTAYLFQVYAQSAVGQSPAAELSGNTPSPTSPAAPEMLVVSNLEHQRPCSKT
ncbi:unnamed protein product [Polarella glacialis]|uniref:Fibronectin type-III domain-containing protein n=1 Tax=Polarella glacialis TaxID=89957 RepID=A0A813JSM8_POLGL|nr:unnamed protein product [Polarella glacialis]